MLQQLQKLLNNIKKGHFGTGYIYIKCTKEQIVSLESTIEILKKLKGGDENGVTK